MRRASGGWLIGQHEDKEAAVSNVRAPGVYYERIEENIPPLELGPTGQVGFLGMASRGPLRTPQRLTSYEDFLDQYGAPYKEGFLADAVKGFFENGGRVCYVVRVAHTAAGGGKAGSELAQQASITLSDRAGLPALRIEARNEGTWGNDIRIDLEVPRPEVQTLLVRDAAAGETRVQIRTGRGFQPGALCRIHDGDAERYMTIAAVEGKELRLTEPLDRAFKSSAPTFIEPVSLELRAEVPGYKERFTNLAFSPASGRYFERYVNTESQLLRVFDLSSESPYPERLPENVNRTMLVGGQDGLDALTPADFIGENSGPGQRFGLGALEVLDDIDLVAIPDLYPALNHGFRSLAQVEIVQHAMLTQCELLKDRFSVLDLPPGANLDQARDWRIRFDSAFGAFYFPWLVVPQEGRRRRVVPPSGHVAGVISRCDQELGVHNPPANAIIEGIVDMDMLLNDEHLGQLNDQGINCMRYAPARGIRIWGARTLSSDPNWRYVNVRRIFNTIRRALEQGTQWVVFEPNTSALWKQISRKLSTFLEQLWLKGYFRGETADQGFYVLCNNETNPPEAVEAGQLFCEIGLAPVRPAEFITFRVRQQMEDRATGDFKD